MQNPMLTYLQSLRMSQEHGCKHFRSHRLASEWMTACTIHVEVDLSLGSFFCRPYTCHHCRWNEGRHIRHATIYGFVHSPCTYPLPRFLLVWSQSAGIYRSDQMALRWSPGREETFWSKMRHAHADTFAASYTSCVASEAGAMAAQEEGRKKAKYLHLDTCHSSIPVAVETTGVFGPLHAPS